ncbi:MAG: hypothetical protein IKD42_05480, partial [Kiritimatiellae bacterium]|nr:hypothetical protein [Kiritimatiellia bacterium]
LRLRGNFRRGGVCWLFKRFFGGGRNLVCGRLGLGNDGLRLRGNFRRGGDRGLFRFFFSGGRNLVCGRLGLGNDRSNAGRLHGVVVSRYSGISGIGRMLLFLSRQFSFKILQQRIEIVLRENIAEASQNGSHRADRHQIFCFCHNSPVAPSFQF